TAVDEWSNGASQAQWHQCQVHRQSLPPLELPDRTGKILLTVEMRQGHLEERPIVLPLPDEIWRKHDDGNDDPEPELPPQQDTTRRGNNHTDTECHEPDRDAPFGLHRQSRQRSDPD